MTPEEEQIFCLRDIIMSEIQNKLEDAASLFDGLVYLDARVLPLPNILPTSMKASRENVTVELRYEGKK